MDSDVLELIRSLGPGAGFIGLLVWYIVRKEQAHKVALDEIQTSHKAAIEKFQSSLETAKDKRIEDAHRVTDRLLDLTDKWHKLIEELARAMTANTSSLDEMRDAVGKLSDRVDKRSTR